MERFLPSLFLGALTVATTQSFADDSMQSGAMTSQQRQMMKDCMAQQKAKDSTVSKADMKSVCTAQIKSKMTSGQMNSGQVSSDPHTTSDGDQPTGSPMGTSPPKQ